MPSSSLMELMLVASVDSVQVFASSSAIEKDPRHHTQKMRRSLQDIKDHLREDIAKVDEPQLRAMFETSAEVLGGLIKAFRDYEEKNETAVAAIIPAQFRFPRG
jgi:hypothetical protein